MVNVGKNFHTLSIWNFEFEKKVMNSSGTAAADSMTEIFGTRDASE